MLYTGQRPLTAARPNLGYETNAQLGGMLITNCNEWVSQCNDPNSSTKQLAKVLINVLRIDCTKAQNGYIQCNYDGQADYISDYYLSFVYG